MFPKSASVTRASSTIVNDPTPTEPRLLVNGNDSEYKVNMSGKKRIQWDWIRAKEPREGVEKRQQEKRNKRIK